MMITVFTGFITASLKRAALSRMSLFEGKKTSVAHRMLAVVSPTHLSMSFINRLQTASPYKQLLKRETVTLGFSVSHESYLGAVYSLIYELWITTNRLFLLCLTYCGRRLIADGCCNLDPLPQCSSPILFFPSLCYCLIIALLRKGASEVLERRK